jgi:UDP-glucose 4-epimerase
VYTSSAAVYGQPAGPQAGEDAPLLPVSVYGRTARVVEDFLRDLAHANVNWRIAILRAFNAAGAHTSGMLGASPRGRPSDLMTVLARAAAGESGDASVYGDDWPTADGSAVRDYVHVQNLAEMHVGALQRLATRHGAMTVNAGSGQRRSVREVLAAFERACGRKLDTRVLPRRAGDVAAISADTSRAGQMLDQRATRDLDAICADAWRWQKNGGRY